MDHVLQIMPMQRLLHALTIGSEISLNVVCYLARAADVSSLEVLFSCAWHECRRG